jgi:serine protease Do
VKVFGRRGSAVVAASLALLAMITVPVWGQPPHAASTVARPVPAPPPAPSLAPQASSAIRKSQPAPGAAPPSTAAAAAANPAPAPAKTPFAQIFADLAGRVVGTVVNISTEAAPAARAAAGAAAQNSAGTTLDEMFRDFFSENGAPGAPGAPGVQVASLGSGFIIDPSGLIVTNDHVIANAERITVTLSDNTALPATIVGRDAISDLALLKINSKAPLPAAHWGDSSKARVGDWVMAIGNPFGLGGTVTAGIISATARDIHSSPYDDYLQTDAAINRGNSGGPMFNLAGEVIGINTVIYAPSGGAIGIGFALPSALARPIVAQLAATGRFERGWIGAHIQPMTEDLAESVGLAKSGGAGAMIAAVDPDSPAAQARLQPGDVILSYGGQPIERSRQLLLLVAGTPPGTQVKLTIWHDGKPHDIELQAAALDPDRKPPAPPEEAPPRPKPPVTVDALGLKLAKITPELRKQFALPDWASGVVIADVPPNGAGAAQGLRPGDLVVAIGRTPVATPQQIPLLAAAARKANRKMVLVRIEQRDGSTRFVALPVEAG